MELTLNRYCLVLESFNAFITSLRVLYVVKTNQIMESNIFLNYYRREFDEEETSASYILEDPLKP